MSFESLLKKYGLHKYMSYIPFIRFSSHEKERNDLESLLKRRNLFPEFLLIITVIISIRKWPQDIATAGDIVSFVLWILILLFIFTLALTNAKTSLLPNRLVGTLGLTIIVYQLAIAMLTSNTGILISAAVGGLILGGVPYILFQLSSGKWIGGGDVKFGFVLGLLLGWKLSLVCIAVMFCLTLISFIIEIIAAKLSRSHSSNRVPTGILWAVSAITCILIGS